MDSRAWACLGGGERASRAYETFSKIREAGKGMSPRQISIWAVCADHEMAVRRFRLQMRLTISARLERSSEVDVVVVACKAGETKALMTAAKECPRDQI